MEPNSKNQQGISDEELIVDALKGNKKSLEVLVKRHQDYIYNISLKMFLNPDDALDATQEVLIKVITSLKTFQQKSKFRTWLYRIVVNHFLNSATRKMEQLYERNFDLSSAKFIDEEKEISEEEVEEVRILCSTAMLLCLNREQRLIYIIGEIFEADHQTGAELFEISTANYRVKLHRARTDLINYVSGKCGLINPKNACRCNKKAKYMIAQGIVDKDKMLFNTKYQEKVREVVIDKKDETSDEIGKLKYYFQDSPYQIRDELDSILSEIIK